MSKYFVRSASENIKEIFNKKQLYKIVSSSDHKNLVDFTYGEKILYGRVDRYFQPIIPNETFFKLQGIGGNSAPDIKVFDFVAEAFHELQAKFKLKAAQGGIDATDRYLSVLKPTAAYENPRTLYSNRAQAFSIAVGNIIKKHEIQFDNFDQFINAMMPYMKNAIRSSSLTFPAFIKSAECPMNVSGLVIEIANINPNNDEMKYEKFYQSKNWEFFVNACNAYGFMIDRNMPNRIIADLNSTHMIEKMKKYNDAIDSADMCITNCYDIVAADYFNSFKSLLYQLYSENRKRRVTVITHNSHKGTREVHRQVKGYSYDDFKAEVSDRTIMDLYMKIRFAEEETQFDEYEKNGVSNIGVKNKGTKIDEKKNGMEKR